GLGKSTLVRHLIGAVTSGRAAFGMTYDPPEPGDVILVAEEDGLDDVIVPQLAVEGADLERVHPLKIEVTDKGKKSLVAFGLDHLELLGARLMECPEVKLIVIDPIISITSRAKIDDNKGADLRRALDPLNALAEATGVSVVLIAHTNKGGGRKAADHIAG